MSDLIDRQTAIDAICATAFSITTIYGRSERGMAAAKEAIRTLKALPSAEPEQRWISVTERLPHDKDYDETFIVTIQCEHVDGWDDYVTGYADWTPHGWDIQSYYMGQIKVTAWMPMPEPMRLESE